MREGVKAVKRAPGSTIITLFLFFFAMVLFATDASHAVSPYVNYQGMLSDSEGTPLNGTLPMTFRIFDDPTSTSAADKLWEETRAGVDVQDGVYSVYLGSVASFDTAQESKTGEFWLEVEVDGEILGPRQPITNVFFALHADEAGKAEMADDADKLDGRDSTDFLDLDTYDADRNAKVDDADATGYAAQAGNADTLDSLHAYQLQERVTGVCPPGQSIRAIEMSGAVTCEEDDAGITDETDPNVLESVKDGVSWDELSEIPTGFLDGTDDGDVPIPLNLAGTRPLGGIISGVNTNPTGYGVYGRASDDAGTNYGLWGRSDSTSGTGALGHATASSGVTTGVHGKSTSGSGRGVYGEAVALSGSAVGVRGESNSVSGVGVSGEALASSGYAAGVQGLSNATSGSGVAGASVATVGPTFGVRGDNYSDIGTGVAGYAYSTGGTAAGVYGHTAASAGKGVWGQHSSNNNGYLGSASDGAYGEHDASGNYGRLGHSQSGAFGFSSDQYGVHGSSDNGTGVRGGSTNGTGVHGLSSLGKAGYFQGGGSGVSGSTLYAQNSSATGIAGYFENQSDDATAVLVQKGTGDLLRGFYDTGDGWDWAIRVQRNGWTTISVLELTGGADLSEQFDVSGAKDEAILGMVVIIDPDNPGQLRVSDEAYDRKVAGIISGAGGVRPGMLMAQRGSEADGANPVALTGRVYCWADASYGRIEPGDMLTTSNTPGHAMKVADHQRAQGAVIGKAMSSLDEGTGLVLVLVSLQ
jgi:hypothetical protein